MSLGTSAAGVNENPARPPQRRSSKIWWVAAGIVLLALAALRGVMPSSHTSTPSRTNPSPQYGIAVNSSGGAVAPAADFTLDSTLGRPLALSELRGRPVLLYFGYTTCPDICPTTLADLRMARSALGKDGDKVQVLFVSVDPERDTVDRLNTYLGAFDPAFIGLTGPVAEIEKVASRFGVYFQKSTVESAAGYLMDHTSAVLLLDADGVLRLMFPYGTTGEQIAADTRPFIR